jgi:CelD/BcsL family acetyltransferase involved in cellulose biosynthesis
MCLKPAAITTRILHPSGLSAADIAGWERLRAAHLDYASPLLSSAFARTLGNVRPDARVALISDADGLGAAFAFFQRPDGLGRPMGAPFADYSGPIVRSDFGLSLTEIVRRSGLCAWRSASLVDPWAQFTRERCGGAETWMICRAGIEPADYLETQRAAHPKRFKNFRRLENQIGREGHVLSLRWGPLDDGLRAELFALKSRQYVASGLVDLTQASRSRGILDAVAASAHGFQTSLWSGDTLISAHFGFRDGRAFHPWIAAYNPDFAHFSPGNILLKRVVLAMPEMGLDAYDLAEGHEHYKKYYTNAGRTLYAASVTTAPHGWLIAAGRAAWRAAGAGNEGSLAQRVSRRLDHGAASEHRLGARLADLATAVRRRRGVTDASPHAAPDDAQAS